MRKLTTMSESELKNESKKLGIPLHGIYSKDNLPESKNGYYIVNMQDSTDGNGTHWVAMIKDNDNNFYFDSFGCIAPIEVCNFLKDFKYNEKEIQDVDSKACGWYCLDFFKSMSYPTLTNFSKFLNSYKNNTELNDNILKSHLQKT
jgi:hypothetical protein